MSVEPLPGLAQRTFRAGAEYDLVVFDRLPSNEQALLTELRADPDFYGVLRPRPESGRTIKAVGKDTALLWLTLQSPGPLPFFFFGKDSTEAVAAIPQLLLDGVLELEDNGRFLSTTEAAGLLANMNTGSAPDSRGRLTLLSEAALAYGERLMLNDPRQLTARLYGFGRQPVTPRWSQLLADREAVLSFLGAGAGTDLRHRLDSDWQEPANKMSGWLVWSSRARNGPHFRGDHYKLYASPAVDALPQTFATVLDVLSTRGGHFKIGSDAPGLLRPDKLVLYFRNQEDLFAVASELAERLKGIAAQGVPFSAEISSDGLLSWGMDPPRSERVLSWQEPESWRLWVARRLAAAMLAAQASPGSGMSPARFALERLQLEGVDIDGWTPSISLWQKNK